MTESLNNGGADDSGSSFANGDGIGDMLGNVCRDQAWDIRGLGLRLFPDKWAHVPNGG